MADLVVSTITLLLIRVWFLRVLDMAELFILITVPLTVCHSASAFVLAFPWSLRFCWWLLMDSNSTVFNYSWPHTRALLRALVNLAYWHMIHFSTCCRFWLELTAALTAEGDYHFQLQSEVVDLDYGWCRDNGHNWDRHINHLIGVYISSQVWKIENYGSSLINWGIRNFKEETQKG